MTVITSDGLKARPEGPKARRSKKKNKGKTETVVPPKWESTKLVERLKYQEAEEQETLGVQDWPTGWEPKYRMSETATPDTWSLEEEIEELVYGHATLEEVAFEWGKFNRPVRYDEKDKGNADSECLVAERLRQKTVKRSRICPVEQVGPVY